MSLAHQIFTDQAIALNKALFKDDLYKLARMFPDSPIYMLNGLASGMDLVAADILNKFCLEEKADLDHRLIGVLPKPLNQYQSEIAKEDFNLFQDLISAHHTSVLDPSNCFNLRTNDATRSTFDGSVADEFYVRQSLFLIAHSSILFAFTDGINNGKKGGTSMLYKLQRMKPLHCQLTVVNSLTTILRLVLLNIIQSEFPMSSSLMHILNPGTGSSENSKSVSTRLLLPQ